MDKFLYSTSTGDDKLQSESNTNVTVAHSVREEADVTLTPSSLKPDNDERREFLIYFMTMQEIFLRSSWQNKYNFILNLLQKLNNIGALTLILGGVKVCSEGKMITYSKITKNAKFIYDKIPNDHNRALELKSLEKVENDYIGWFSKLPPPRQVTVFLGLLRIGGGGITMKMDREILKHYNKVMLEKQQRESVKEFEKKPEDTESFTRDIQESDIFRERKPSDKPEALKALRKTWKDAINKYRKQIEKKLAKRLKKDKKGKKAKGGKKSSKVSSKAGKKTKPSKSSKKKGTKSKTTKSKKSSKGKKGKKKKNKDMTIDYIKLMPVWTVMQIFNYLDPKTLKKIKAVNEYWSYVSDAVTEERKARKYLNKILKKIEGSLGDDPDVVTDPTEESCKVEYYKMTMGEEQKYKMMKTGASNKKILKTKKKLHEWSLHKECFNRMGAYYALPVSQLSSFPRVLDSTQPPVYKLPYNCLKDINLVIPNPIEVLQEEHLSANPCSSSEREASRGGKMENASISGNTSAYSNTEKSGIPIIMLMDEMDLDNW